MSFERGAQIFAARFDGAQEGRKRQPADIGIAGALLLARDAVLEIGELALEIGLHAVERRQPALQLVDAKALAGASACRRVSLIHYPSHPAQDFLQSGIAFG